MSGYEDQSHRFVITGEDPEGRPRTICDAFAGQGFNKCCHVGLDRRFVALPAGQIVPRWRKRHP